MSEGFPETVSPEEPRRDDLDPAITDAVAAAEAGENPALDSAEEVESTTEAGDTAEAAPETPAEPEATAAEPADTETTDPAPATTPEEAESADDEAGEDAPDETPETRAARLEAENVALREREAQHLRRIGELEGQVGELQGQIAALTTRVSELEARLGVRPTPTPTPAEAGARTGTGPVVPGAEAVGAARGEALPATDLAEQIRIRSMAAIDATCNELLERGVNTVYVDKVRLDMRNLMHQNMIDVNREHGRVMRERTAADLENADLRRRLGDGTTAPAPTPDTATTAEAVDPAITDGVAAAEGGENPALDAPEGTPRAAEEGRRRFLGRAAFWRSRGPQPPVPPAAS